MFRKGYPGKHPKNEAMAEKPMYAQVALSTGEEMKRLHEGGDMLAQDEDTGRQEGSSKEGTRGKGAYSHKAMEGGAQEVCKKLAGEQEVGLPLYKSRQTQAGKQGLLQGCSLHQS